MLFNTRMFTCFSIQEIRESRRINNCSMRLRLSLFFQFKSGSLAKISGNYLMILNDLINQKNHFELETGMGRNT